MKMVIGYIFCAVLMILWGGIGEYSTMSSTEMSHLNNLMTMPVAQEGSVLGFITTYVSWGADALNSLWHLFWMQVGFYGGEFSIFFIILWLPIAAGIIYGIFALLRGVNA